MDKQTTVAAHECPLQLARLFPRAGKRMTQAERDILAAAVKNVLPLVYPDKRPRGKNNIGLTSDNPLIKQ